jgi:leucyl/phenylalanyl-tRNA--protein transferase
MEHLAKVKAEQFLDILARGSFPMAEDRFINELHIITPKTRAILPLHHFHCPRRLARVVRQDSFEVRINYSFDSVIRRCSARPTTWINQQILDGYLGLHKLGYAHSVETWQGDNLVGGLYGVALGGVFFGESMFSKATNASKVALVHLVARMRAGNFSLLDTQFMTSHLRQFGAREITAQAFNEKLAFSKKISADFFALPAQLSGASALQEIGHIS